MTRLCDVFNGWNGYQMSLVHAVEELSGDQLAWKPSSHVRSIGELTRHIAMGRIDWFVRMGALGSEELAALNPLRLALFWRAQAPVARFQ